MIRSVRALLAIWLVMLAAVGIVISTNRAQKAYRCIVTLDEGATFPPEYFDVKSSHVLTGPYQQQQYPIYAATESYEITTNTKDWTAKIVDLYWFSYVNGGTRQLLTEVNPESMDARATKSFAAIVYSDKDDASHNLVSVFDSEGRLLQQKVLPFSGTLIRTYNAESYFVYDNANAYYFVSLPELTIHKIPKHYNSGGGLSTRSPDGDKVGILTTKLMLSLLWVHTGQTIEWQFPRIDMNYAGRSLLWSPDGRYLVVEFDEHNGTIPTPRSLIYLFDTLNEQSFTERAEPLLDTTSFASGVRGWQKATWTSDGMLFYYAPYWSEQVKTTGVYDSNSAIRPLEQPYWALVQYDPRTHQRRVLVQDILEYSDPSFDPRWRYDFRVVQYQSGTNNTWAWVGADPRQWQILYSGSGKLALISIPNRLGEHWAMFVWDVQQERNTDIIVVFDVLRGNHWSLPIGTLRDSVVRTTDNQAAFYVSRVGGGFAAGRLDLVTGQPQRLTDSKPLVEMQANPNNTVLVFWEDAKGKRQVEYYRADGKRLGTFPVTGNIVGMVGRVSVDGKLGLFGSTNARQALLELSPEGGNESKVLRALVGGKLSQIGWSPDGRAFSFAQVDAQNNHSLMILSREAQQISQWNIAFWPDGSAATYEWSTCDVPHRFGDTAQG